MPCTDYLPSKDADLLAFVQNVSTILTAAPIPLGQTAAIATTYAGKVSLFASCLTASTNPGTRTSVTVGATRDARRDLVAYTRILVRSIQGTMTVTDDQRRELGITVRKAPSPIGPPTIIPTIDVVKRYGTSVEIRIHDGSESRGKPAGVAGASVYSFVGPVCPTDPALFKSEGITTRMQTTLDFDPTLSPGTVVWIAACFFSPRGQTGTACQPLSTMLAGGAMQIAA